MAAGAAAAAIAAREADTRVSLHIQFTFTQKWKYRRQVLPFL